MVAVEKEGPLECRKEIKDIWNVFFTDTTLHGCRPIQRSNKHYVQRFLWTALVLTAGGFLASNTIKFYLEFRSYPFETQSRVERVSRMQLPAISLCNVNQFSMAKYNLSKKTVDTMLSQSLFAQAFGNLTNGTLTKEEKERIDSIPPSEGLITRENFILMAYINNRELNVTSEFTNNTSPIFNKCFTFNGVKEDGTGGDISLTHGQYLSILLNVNQSDNFPYCTFAGVHVLFHDPHECPSPVGQTVDVAPGFLTTVTLERKEYRFLPRPYKSYGEEYCEDVHETSKIKKLLWHQHYSWVSCIEECVIQTAVAECGCRPKDLVPEFLSKRVCSVEELYHCLYKTVGKVRDSALTHNATECECPQPCKFVHYGIGSSETAFPTRQVADFLVSRGKAESYQWLRDNYLAVEVTFGGMVVQHVEHVPTFSFQEIISRLGGQMGFFLGASLLTITELIEAVLLTLASVIAVALRRERKSKNEDRQIICDTKDSKSQKES